MMKNNQLLWGDLIDVEDTIALLTISRPTFKKYREKFEISEFKIQKKIYFSKTEILQNVYALITPIDQKFNFVVFSDDQFEEIKVDKGIYDLRKIDQIDGHGAVSLILHLLSEVQADKQYVHLILDSSCDFIKAMGFFDALKMYYNAKIFWDELAYDSIPVCKYNQMIKLPLSRLGVVGAHHSITDDLITSLNKQGYSVEICSYIGWAIGELADNSGTHAKVHPCFVYFEQFGKNQKFLQFTIGDIGIGISPSLKSNPKYVSLSDERALLTAFKPYVSGRSDEEKRGKGLTDVLKIAMECGTSLKVESNGLGVFFAFNAGVDNFSSHIPLFKGRGTIISLLFIDGNFSSFERSDVEEYIDDCLEKI